MLRSPGIYIECARCKEMVLLNDVNNKCICSRCEKKEIILDELKDRRKWNKAYKEWMKKKGK